LLFHYETALSWQTKEKIEVLKLPVTMTLQSTFDRGASMLKRLGWPTWATAKSPIKRSSSSAGGMVFGGGGAFSFSSLSTGQISGLPKTENKV
jgi:hypothetical protein